MCTVVILYSCMYLYVIGRSLALPAYKGRQLASVSLLDISGSRSLWSTFGSERDIYISIEPRPSQRSFLPGNCIFLPHHIIFLVMKEQASTSYFQQSSRHLPSFSICSALHDTARTNVLSIECPNPKSSPSCCFRTRRLPS